MPTGPRPPEPPACARSLAASPVPQAIVGFHRDEVGDWVAELACGHQQHTRHDPPWQLRPWVVTAAGRQTALGQPLACKKCADGAPRDFDTPTPIGPD